MRDAKSLAACGGDEASGERLARRERHGMHQDVEVSPVRLKALEGGRNLSVLGDIEGQGERYAEALGEIHHAPL